MQTEQQQKEYVIDTEWVTRSWHKHLKFVNEKHGMTTGKIFNNANANNQLQMDENHISTSIIEKYMNKPTTAQLVGQQLMLINSCIVSTNPAIKLFCPKKTTENMLRGQGLKQPECNVEHSQDGSITVGGLFDTVTPTASRLRRIGRDKLGT